MSKTKIIVEDVYLTKDFIGNIDAILGTKMVTNADQKEQKEGDIILEPMVMKRAAPMDHLATISDSISLVGKMPSAIGPSLGGFHTPYYMSRPNEIGGTPKVCWEEIAECPGTAYPNGTVYVIDEICTHQLA